MHALRSRSLLLAILGVEYVAFAALRETSGSVTAWPALVLLPLGLMLVWIGTGGPKRGVDQVDRSAKRGARIGATGAGLIVSAWTGPPDNALLETAANLGTAMSTLAALVALARIAPLSGLLQPPPATRRMDAVALCSLFWGMGVAVPAARLLAPERTTLLDPLAMNYATLAAATGSIGLIIAAAGRVRAMRRLELGVADRAAGAFALSVVVLALAIPCALLRVAPVDRVMVVAATLASSLVLFACVSPEPTSVARAMRIVLATTVLGAPVVLASMAWTVHFPASTPLVILFVGIASTLVGLAARVFSAPFGPARSRWLEAIHKANEAALHPDPDVAIRDALATVRSLLPGESASPVLFRASPDEMLTIDRAGYVHSSHAQVPPHLYEIAEREPERTVRAEVLRSLQVRRADLRFLLTWFESRGLLAATLVHDEEGPIGLIGIPQGNRKAPTSLEEVRALRLLADRIGAILGVSSALARSRAREVEVRGLADRRGNDVDLLKHRMSLETLRHKALAERLAQPVVTTAYSPAAQAALEQCRRFGSLGIPLTLLSPPGVDPIPWAAAGHLASPRHDHPLAIVVADEATEQSIERWRDPSLSPLVLADGGTLLIVHVAVLSRAVQDFIAACLAERVSPSGSASPLDVAIMVSVTATVDALVAGGRISTALADWLGDRAVPLPPLAWRTEDLRAIALDHLARFGTQMRGTPYGIDERALAQLLEHAWPGNDVEFAAVVLRCAVAAAGPRITLEDLLATGFRSIPASPATPMPDHVILEGLGAGKRRSPG